MSGNKNVFRNIIKNLKNKIKRKQSSKKSIRNMKLVKFLLQHIFNVTDQSNSKPYMGNLGWNNTAPVGGANGRFGRYRGVETGPIEQGTGKPVQKYTAQEVKTYLHGTKEQHSERARPVMQQASQFSSLIDTRMKRHFLGRERVFERLPYVLYEYSLGTDPHEIASHISYFSDSEDIEHAMDFVAGFIANRINKTQRQSSYLSW
jgi:hypothetical protein